MYRIIELSIYRTRYRTCFFPPFPAAPVFILLTTERKPPCIRYLNRIDYPVFRFVCRSRIELDIDIRYPALQETGDSTKRTRTYHETDDRTNQTII